MAVAIGSATAHEHAARAGLPTGERVAAALLLVGLFALRVVYLLHHEFDSDEHEHLHLAWVWLKGLLPYRDLQDNHPPLFHLAMAPILAWVGERADALHLMRFAMLPLFAAVLLAVHGLGRALWSPRVGLWGAVLTALVPQHFLTSLEFRADDLWAALWLVGLAVLLGGPPTARRALAAGVVAGAAVATSLKSWMLVVTLGAAFAIAWALRPDRAGLRPAAVARLVACWLLGLLVVPSALVAWFAARGALGALFDSLIRHNAVVASLWAGPPWRRAILPLALVPLLFAARRLALGAPGDLGMRRAVYFLSGTGYYSMLISFWPLITPQNYLPVQPLGALLIAALLLGGAPPGPLARQPARAAALALLCAGLLVALLLRAAPWPDRTGPQRALLTDVQALTGPDDTVMDLKGETVFRRRPVPWVIETVTQERLRRGLLQDTMPESLIAHRTAVVVPDHYKLSPRIREFMNAHYLRVGSLRVLGRALGEPDAGSDAIVFEIAIPERYLVLARAADGSGWRPARGVLDGVTRPGPRDLEPGHHAYLPAAGERELAVIWARAVERGYAPLGPARAPGS